MVDFLERGVRKFKREGFRTHRALFRRAGGMPEHRQLELLTQLNVIVQIEHLWSHPSVARCLRQGKLALHGWVYDIRNGEILQLNERTGEFLPWP